MCKTTLSRLKLCGTCHVWWWKHIGICLCGSVILNFSQNGFYIEVIGPNLVQWDPISINHVYFELQWKDGFGLNSHPYYWCNIWIGYKKKKNVEYRIKFVMEPSPLLRPWSYFPVSYRNSQSKEKRKINKCKSQNTATILKGHLHTIYSNCFGCGSGPPTTTTTVYFYFFHLHTRYTFL